MRGEQGGVVIPITVEADAPGFFRAAVDVDDGLVLCALLIVGGKDDYSVDRVVVLGISPGDFALGADVPVRYLRVGVGQGLGVVVVPGVRVGGFGGGVSPRKAKGWGVAVGGDVEGFAAGGESL